MDGHPFERPHFIVNARAPHARGAARLEALRTAVERMFPGAGRIECAPLDAREAADRTERIFINMGGRLERVRGVRVTSARRIDVTSKEDVLVDCDGEVVGRLPATYTVLPGAVTVCA